MYIIFYFHIFDVTDYVVNREGCLDHNSQHAYELISFEIPSHLQLTTQAGYRYYQSQCMHARHARNMNMCISAAFFIAHERHAHMRTYGAATRRHRNLLAFACSNTHSLSLCLCLAALWLPSMLRSNFVFSHVHVSHTQEQDARAPPTAAAHAGNAQRNANVQMSRD